MKLKDQVVRVELTMELKELGVKQESQIFWLYYTHTSLTERDWKQLSRKEYDMEEFEWELDYNLCRRADYIDRVSAFTVAELGEMLPDGFYSYHDEFHGWQCVSPWGFRDRNIIPSKTVDTILGPLTIPPVLSRVSEEANTEANARAKMVIYLIKAGIIKAEEIGK